MQDTESEKQSVHTIIPPEEVIRELKLKKAMKLKNKAHSFKIVNPTFRLDERPSVVEVLYTDVFRVFTGNEPINIWVTKIEDYLDDTRELSDAESQSYDVRMFHLAMDMEEH